MSDPKIKLELLERTVLELGTELFSLKGMVAKSRESHEQFLTTMRGLKQLLDEKGLITPEDFDTAVQLGAAIESFNPHESDLYQEMEKQKKQSH